MSHIISRICVSDGDQREPPGRTLKGTVRLHPPGPVGAGWLAVRHDMRMAARAETLLGVLTWVEVFTATRATRGLTDDEYFWEPVPRCWSVRTVEEGAVALDHDDRVVGLPADSEQHPITTIAWNLAHVCDAPGALAEFDFLGGNVPAGEYGNRREPPGSARDATERFWQGWTALKSRLGSATDNALERSWSWSFGETNGWMHAALVLNEVSHHLAQVCELRDLYRHRRWPDEAVDVGAHIAETRSRTVRRGTILLGRVGRRR